MSLLVSAYYRIPSKQPHTFYQAHLKRFFSFLKGKPILFFCQEETQREIESFGVPLDTVKFVILPFSQLYQEAGVPLEMWKETCKIDPEKYHTPELGIVWSCKKEFVRLASERKKDIDWFIWIDAGCIRNEMWEESCKEFTNCKLQTLAPGVYLQKIKTIQTKQFYTYPDISIAGAIIVFHKNYILPYRSLYNSTLLQYYINNVPFIMDQYIMLSMINVENEWLHTIDATTLSLRNDKWFFFLEWI